MQRTTPPFRVDHVGSLLRPPELIAARDKFEAGELAHDALSEVEEPQPRERWSVSDEAGMQLPVVNRRFGRDRKSSAEVAAI